MKTEIKKTSDGTWLIRSEPIPFGKTSADVSVVVQRYGRRYRRWFCSEHYREHYRRPYSDSLPNCSHILAVQSMEFEVAQDNADFYAHDWDRDEGLSGRAANDLTDPFDPFELGG